MTPGLRDLNFFLYSIFVSEPILNLCEGKHYEDTFFLKNDLKGHSRSQKMTFLFKSISRQIVGATIVGATIALD